MGVRDLKQPADFVHLHVHSEYSLLDGAAQLEKLVQQAKALRLPRPRPHRPRQPLRRHRLLHGRPEGRHQAHPRLRALRGAGQPQRAAAQDGGYEGANHCTVLVRNQTGYPNLIKLVSKAYLEGFYYKPRVDRELLAQHADGLLVLSGCLNSEVSRLLTAGDEAKARGDGGLVPGGLRQGPLLHGGPGPRARGAARVTAETLRIARAIGAPLVGTNDSHYLEAEHARAHEALLCIQTGTTITDPNRWRFSTEEFYLKSADEMARVFAELPEAYRTRWPWPSAATSRSTFGQFHLPRYQVPDGHTLDSYLEELAREGLTARYGSSPRRRAGRAPRARARRHREDGLRRATSSWCGTSSRYARRQGIAVGPGRGSSAGSLVAYCLGITNVDPIRYGLLFERFLNPERISMPDMDIDFADDRRDEVIRYVADRYGADRVAHIITFGTMGAKAAHPRRGARARHALRRRRPHRQARPELPAQHHARRVAREVARARGAGQARSLA